MDYKQGYFVHTNQLNNPFNLMVTFFGPKLQNHPEFALHVGFFNC